MDLKRRTLLTATAAAVVACSLPAAGIAQSFPSEPVRLLVGFPPGGSTDAIGRIVAEGMSAELGQNVRVENVPGAGSNIAAGQVARATADGHTLLLATAGTHAINASIYPDIPFDHIEDFAPVSLVTTSANVLLVRPDFPATTMEEFVEMARAGDQRITMANPGNGTTPHMTAAMLDRELGGNMTFVNYTGAAPAMVDLMAGRVDALFNATQTSVEQVETGTVMALGISSAERNPLLPDVPAIGEVVDGFEAVAWWGVVAPAGTPPEAVETLNAAINAALANEDMQRRMADLGTTPTGGTAEEFAQHIVDETAKWSAIIEAAGISLD